MSSRDRARAHLKHAHHCTCGRVVHGNGAKWQHVQMHHRRGDGHHGITAEAFAAYLVALARHARAQRVKESA